MRSATWVCVVLACATGAQARGEELYNGIVLPDIWPPRVKELTAEPIDVPYLKSPPAVIPIDLGRQLFVDDFLIESTTMERTFHRAEYVKDNPVLAPDKPWEATPPNPTAMVFSDGVWYDPAQKLFKMWYMGGYVASTCYATSADGLHWIKPALDIKQGTNIVDAARRDSATVWLDLDEKDPARRYKFFRVSSAKGWRVHVYVSADGIHWGEPAGVSPPCGDRTSVFYNPFRKVWVYSLRANSAFGRARRYHEHADAVAGAKWTTSHWWVGADRLDEPRQDLKTRPQLYNLDAVAYESVMLGLFTIWRGQPPDRAKPNNVCLGFSRDGFHWHRPDRRAFVDVSESKEDWNWGNVQSAGGGCLVVGERLYFYVSARKGIPSTTSSGVCSTGLATLRRDGFASMAAEAGEASLTTRAIRFAGRHLWVNVDSRAGELRAELLDRDGGVIAPFSRDNCLPVAADSTCQPVKWKGADDLRAVAGKTVRVRFHMSNGRIYAFWVSRDESGASGGYVAAGGPGFSGSTDTAGRR